jgi:hypothetical protein
MVTGNHSHYNGTLVWLLSSTFLDSHGLWRFTEKLMKKKESPQQERGTSNVSIRLPDELVAWIDEQAAKARRSRGSFIRLALEDLKMADSHKH